MRLIKIIATLIISISILLCKSNLPVHAVIISDSESNISPCAVIHHPVTFDQYTDAIFPSIGAAKNYFGWDFNYYQTYHYYNGTVYNWYYGFTDGTKQFFRVADLGYDDTLSFKPEQTDR